MLISRYNFLNESLEVGQEIMVRTASGWSEAEVKKISGNTVYWSNKQGQMGSKNVNDVRPITTKDLRDKYFQSNSKFSKFYVPFEVIRETEKAFLLGYNGKGIWVPKKLIDQVWPNKYNIPNVPRDGYQISMLVYFDKDRQVFFDNYANYIHEQNRVKKTDKYQGYLQGNRKLLSEVKEVVKKIYIELGLKREPLVEWEHFDTCTFKIDNRWKVVAKGCSLNGLTFEINGSTFDASKNALSLERRMMLVKLAKNIKAPTFEKLKAELVSEYESTKKSEDKYADYSDDRRVWKAEQLRKELEHKLKTFLNSL